MKEPETRPEDKPLDRLDRLEDMLHFPVAVHAGATANVLLTIVLTWIVEGWVLGGGMAPYAPASVLVPAPLVWVALVLGVNLTPVLVLRWLDKGTRPMARLGAMDFVRDQHRFSDWVYLAASANMAIWVLVSWTVFVLHRSVGALVGMLVVAFLATFSPVLLRRWDR